MLPPRACLTLCSTTAMTTAAFLLCCTLDCCAFCKLVSSELTPVRMLLQVRRSRVVLTMSGVSGTGAQFFYAAVWCAVSRRLDFWQQMGGARHGVPGGKMCSLGDNGSGKSTPRARGGSGAELRVTKVRAGARCSNGCMWSCSHSTARAPCQCMGLEVIPIRVVWQV